MLQASGRKSREITEVTREENALFLISEAGMIRLIPQAEILLGEYGQRIQDAAERAYAAGRIGRENYLAILAERKRREVKA